MKCSLIDDYTLLKNKTINLIFYSNNVDILIDINTFSYYSSYIYDIYLNELTLAKTFASAHAAMAHLLDPFEPNSKISSWTSVTSTSKQVGSPGEFFNSQSLNTTLSPITRNLASPIVTPHSALSVYLLMPMQLENLKYFRPMLNLAFPSAWKTIPF